MTLTAPSPNEIDQKATEYNRLKDELLTAMLAAKEKQAPLDELKEQLIDLVRNFGSQHAEKSKLLHGIKYELMATFGTSYPTDAAAVEEFRKGLVKNKQARLLKKLFTKVVRWDISPEAASIVRGEKLSKPLLALYARCTVPKPRTPTLDVREKTV